MHFRSKKILNIMKIFVFVLLKNCSSYLKPSASCLQQLSSICSRTKIAQSAKYVFVFFNIAFKIFSSISYSLSSCWKTYLVWRDIYISIFFNTLAWDHRTKSVKINEKYDGTMKMNNTYCSRCSNCRNTCWGVTNHSFLHRQELVVYACGNHW